MPFLNRYNSSNNSYFNSLQIGNHIYIIGQKFNGKIFDGLITKVDQNGEIIWEKKHFSQDGLGERFNKCIKCQNDDFLIYGTSSDYKKHFIKRVNKDGDVIWKKYFNTNDNFSISTTFNGLTKLNGENYFILLTDVCVYTKREFSVIRNNHNLIKFDSNGDIILKKILTDSSLLNITTCHSMFDTIALAGEKFDSTHGRIGVCIVLNSSFSEIGKFALRDDKSTGSDIRITNLAFIGEGLYLSGTIGYTSNSFICNTYSFNNLEGSKEVKVVEYFNKDYICFNDKGIYFSRPYYDNNIGKSSIYKYDTNLNSKWIKGIDVAQNNFFPSFLINNNLILNTYANDYVFYTDLDLTGCKTVNRPLIEETVKNLYFYNDFEFSILDSQSVVVNQNSISQILEYSKQIICNHNQNNSLQLQETGTQIQSSHLYLQATGSTGEDSTMGYHLRWALRGGLEKHLPKGDYGVPNNLYNRNDDYVKIYKVPYQKVSVTLDLTQNPSLVFDNKRMWVYNINGKNFNIKFKNATKYNAVRLNVNPLESAKLFIKNYGSELIEIICFNELAFAVTPNFNLANTSGEVKLELMTVTENRPSAQRYVSLRKQLTSSQCNQHFVSENIKTLRFQSTVGAIMNVEFEFYSSFIHTVIKNSNLTFLGKFALTKNTQVAYNRLEPVPDVVNGKWLRYNEDAYVNIQNYKDKWNGSSVVSSDETILKTVDKYLELSNDPLNPLANETFVFDGSSEDQNDNPSFEISNLNILQIGALDYHVARMIGLGTLDLEATNSEDKYIYISEYISECDLGDGNGISKMQHLYCSLPTSLEDNRLPLPVNLKELVKGVIYDNDTDVPKLMTDAEGFSADGNTRFITLYHEEIPQDAPEIPFFNSEKEFDSSTYTEPVFAGIEHTLNDSHSISTWDKPELAFDARFKNIDYTVPTDKNFETVSIIIPEPQNQLFLHRQKQEGKHHYSSYGINWFSRATSSQVIRTIETKFPVVNTLLPPHNINALLIRKESPLLLTSRLEQDKYKALVDSGATDKTLVRLIYDYDSSQELKNYHKEINGNVVNGYVDIPDNKELFADEIEIFFRHFVPNSISGNVLDVSDDISNELLAVVKTSPYTLISAGSTNNQIVPTFPNATQNYIGSLLMVKDQQYIIHEAYLGANNYPEFKVFKRKGEPIETPQESEIFVVVENMQNLPAWNTANPMSYKIPVLHNDLKTIHREEVKIVSPDGQTVETHLQKFRGVYEDAKMEKFIEQILDYSAVTAANPQPQIEYKFRGIYKITFENNYNLPALVSTNNSNNFEWYNGTVRLHTYESNNFRRREFKVIRTENAGITGQNLILYIQDPNFNELAPVYNRPDSIVEGVQKINYYPGYKVYLYVNQTVGLTEANVLPAVDQDEHYSVFGLRSHISTPDLASKISTPCLMFGQHQREPEKPHEPLGSLYATRPDFYGKSTYTFVVGFSGRPYSVQFNRTSDIQILSALFKKETVDHIQKNIFKQGNDIFYGNRWKNLLSFDYRYANTPSQNGLFELIELEGAQASLPFPDNPDLISAIQNFVIEHNKFYNNLPTPVVVPNSISNFYQEIIPKVEGRNEKLEVIDFVRDVIHNCFVPLTEIPVIYKYIKKEIDGYYPLPKKQVIRDRNGNLLKPEDPDFEIAPMMTIKKPQSGSNVNEILFTDFGIDGASKAKYFYAAREFNMQMQGGEYSDIIGPINLVNAAPATAPEIVKVLPILENRVLNVNPKIQFEINSYIESQSVTKIVIYRSFNTTDALSVRTMKEVKSVDFSDKTSDKTWIFADEFEDMNEVPFGDPLYYRIVALRKIEYKDVAGQLIIDYAPSEASKLIITNVMENYSPEAPSLKYYSEPISQNGELQYVVLNCQKTTYKGKYYLYKMNKDGNWFKIHEIHTNDEQLYFSLFESDLKSYVLNTKDEEGDTIYHHFKVVVENTAGMISSKENILTIPSQENWVDVGGIDYMIVEGTLIVRPN